MATLTELPANYLFQNQQTKGSKLSPLGSPSGVIVPDYLGQMAFDATNSDWYIATGTTNTGWKKLT
jgi:hypothetical protein